MGEKKVENSSGWNEIARDEPLAGYPHSCIVGGWFFGRRGGAQGGAARVLVGLLE
jgi:hypothetical protein